MSTNDTTTEDRPIYEIPATNLSALQAKLDEMNRRAVKLGCEPTTLKIVEEFEVERRREHTRIKYMVKYYKVEVVGQSPKLNGWKLLACIERQPSGENLVRTVPGETVPESYRTTDTHCDHCHTARFRKEVFILKHDDGRHAQVGRSCIADFLGHVSVENICGRAAWEFGLAEEMSEAGDESYGSRVETTVEMMEFVSATAICVRRLGWLSRTKAAEMDTGYGQGPMSTSSIAWTICTSHDRNTLEMIEESSLFAEERDMEIAAEAIAWGRGLGTTGVGDYIYNLGVAVRLEVVTWKTSGIVASVIAAYLREKERVGELGMKAKEAQRTRRRRRRASRIRRCDGQVVEIHRERVRRQDPLQVRDDRRQHPDLVVHRQQRVAQGRRDPGHHRDREEAQRVQGLAANRIFPSRGGPAQAEESQESQGGRGRCRSTAARRTTMSLLIMQDNSNHPPRP